MNIRLDFDPGKLPRFIDQLPTWQRELAHEVYNCGVHEDEKREEHGKNRKAVELFWQGEPVLDPPFEGRYRLDHALEDFAYMTFGKKVVFAFKDAPGKSCMQAECPLGTWGAGGLLANELHALMLDVRLHPRDYVCSDGVWTAVTDKWCRLAERGNA